MLRKKEFGLRSLVVFFEWANGFEMVDNHQILRQMMEQLTSHKQEHLILRQYLKVDPIQIEQKT